MSLITIITLIVIGILAGILSGMVGVGGGIIIVPALVYFLGMTQHGAQGTSLAVLLPPLTILAVINYYRAGSLNIGYAVIISLAFVLGGYFGSKFSLTYFSEAAMKKVFGIIMLVASLKLVFFSK